MAEPVAWIRKNGFRFTAEIEPQDDSEVPLYAAPQPAPDVAALVEALTELCDEIDNHEIHTAISKTSILWFKRKARAALDAHRSRGCDND